MIYNFDKVVDRRGTDCAKWQFFGDDPLPLWVADMDFVSPEPVIRALKERVEHGIFGYGMPPPELTEVVCERMQALYDWRVTPDQVLFAPSLVSGLNIACRAIGQPGDGVLVQTPVYPPFLSAPEFQNRVLNTATLSAVNSNGVLHYEVDYDAFEAAIPPKTNLFLLCNPHNPIGRNFTPEELSRMAEICLRREVVICSDEIHADLRLGDSAPPHVPIATLSPEIADRCITLVSPSKTFNLPGLKCGMMIIQNAKLRQTIEKAMRGIVGYAMNIMGFTAALAAYTEGQEWLEQVLSYLTANRDYTFAFIQENFPNIVSTFPEVTYLIWLDCRQTGIEGNPHQFFLSEGNVALNDGQAFGPGGEGFVRLNFACPRPILTRALDQMYEALAKENLAGVVGN